MRDDDAAVRRKVSPEELAALKARAERAEAEWLAQEGVNVDDLWRAANTDPPDDGLERLISSLYVTDSDGELLIERESMTWRDAPVLDLLLGGPRDGIPTWWPLRRERYNYKLAPWTPEERRRVLLMRLRDRLPGDFPLAASTSDERRQLVQAFSAIRYFLCDCEAWDILASE